MYYCGLATFIAAKRNSLVKKIAAICISTSVIWFVVNHLQTPSFRLVFFDVGRDNAFFVQTRSANCLIDIGGRKSADHIYWTIRPYLMSQGIQKLNWVLTAARKPEPLEKLKDNFRLEHAYVKQKIPHYAIQLDHDTWIQPIWIDGKFRETTRQHQPYHWQSISDVAGYEIVHHSERILCVTQMKRYVFDALFKQNMQPAGTLYLMSIPENSDEFEESFSRFLKQVSPHTILLNQRENAEEIENRLREQTKATVLSIAKTGTITLQEIDGRLEFSQFLKDARDGSLERTVPESDMSLSTTHGVALTVKHRYTFHHHVRKPDQLAIHS
jgi:hypothetical protein